MVIFIMGGNLGSGESKKIKRTLENWNPNQRYKNQKPDVCKSKI